MTEMLMTSRNRSLIVTAPFTPIPHLRGFSIYARQFLTGTNSLSINTILLRFKSLSSLSRCRCQTWSSHPKEPLVSGEVNWLALYERQSPAQSWHRNSAFWNDEGKALLAMMANAPINLPVGAPRTRPAHGSVAFALVPPQSRALARRKRHTQQGKGKGKDGGTVCIILPRAPSPARAPLPILENPKWRNLPMSFRSKMPPPR
ncbi:hypothetical protein GGR50DRAFT_635542 [Xylaria sp. CBS 124048]|nr:hypothetical protein GGR50DRAFT_635542 [Xylaria sp. CBS 124048]